MWPSRSFTKPREINRDVNHLPLFFLSKARGDFFLMIIIIQFLALFSAHVIKKTQKNNYDFYISRLESLNCHKLPASCLTLANREFCMLLVKYYLIFLIKS